MQSASTIRRRGAGVLVSALVGITLVAVPQVAHADASDGAMFAALANRAIRPWVGHEDRVPRFGYGPPALGQALMRSGYRQQDREMVLMGIDLVTRTVRHARAHAQVSHRRPNPIELLTLATSYRWAEAHLSHDDAFKRVAPVWGGFLAHWRGASVGRSARRCYLSPVCWSNYKGIDAAGILELTRTRVSPAKHSMLADRRAGRRARALLSSSFVNAVGRGAAAWGQLGSWRGLGIVSDPPTYPLAYHTMSVMAAARGLQLLGGRAPVRLRRAFKRAMLAEAAFAGPDGDVAYTGRSQGLGWTLGATAFAGRVCAGLFAHTDPRTAGICETLAERAADRLTERHGFGPTGINMVPRLDGVSQPFTWVGPSRRGLDHYVRAGTINALTAMFLMWAADAPSPAGVRPLPLPLDDGGAFLDPEHSRLAVVRRGDVWFAVRGARPQRSRDLRNDFGLIALKVRGADGRWRDIVRPRPDARASVRVASAGPTLLRGGVAAAPRGDVISIHRSGTVFIRGRFTTLKGTTVESGVRFTFRPTMHGVQQTVRARSGDRLSFVDFLPTRGVSVRGGSRLLLFGHAASQLSARRVMLRRYGHYSSAYDLRLRAYRRFAVVPRSGLMRWRQWGR